VNRQLFGNSGLRDAGSRRVELVQQRLDDARVELRAGDSAELLARLLWRACRAIRSIGDDRIVGVAGRDDSREQRDLLAGKAVGVSSAVPALVACSRGGRAGGA